MTSRERVLAAVDHKRVDRMPIDLGVHYSTGISAFAYRDLRRHLGLPEKEIEIIDPTQFLARVDEDVLERFHCDGILLHPGYRRTFEWNPRGDYRFRIPTALDPRLQADGSWLCGGGARGPGLRMPAGGFFFDGTGFDLFEEAEDDLLDRYAREAERVFKETGFFTLYIGYNAFWGDVEDFMCDMVADPDAILERNRRTLDSSLRHVGKVIDRMGRFIQGIAVGGDWGTQSGPFVRPSLYEDLCLPYLREFCDFVHQNSDFRIFNHSCGAVREFIPHFIEAGIDILNPVQISATGMDPQALKTDFGDRITFWGGGCDTQNVLNRGTPDDVRRNVKDLVSIFRPGSGFVFNQVHNVMGNVRPENVVAMLDSAWENAFA
jgi:uroporphyrinogen decarboxylase